MHLVEGPPPIDAANRRWEEAQTHSRLVYEDLAHTFSLREPPNG